MRILWLCLLSLSVLAQEIPLAPGDPASLGSWTQAIQALRLYPTPATGVRYEGPALSLRLFGEIALGQARYAFLLGVSPQNEVGLWLDRDRDGRLIPEEELPKTRASQAVLWTVVLTSVPGNGSAFPYPLQILWPEGRSYVFLLGGAPRAGEFQGRALVLVDGDLDGVFGTKDDFLGVDVDGDGRIYAEPDGHERFKWTEAFTLGGASYEVRQVAPDGMFLRVEPTAYVPPKIPLIPGAPAPDFSFHNFLDDQPLRLSHFRGKVVLLDFWATWCPPCMASLPGLRALYEEMHPKGFEIVGVSLDESGEDLRRVLSTYGILWPNAFFGRRWDNPVANLYRVHQIPTTYLLDKKGVIRFRDLRGEELRAAIQALLAEPMGAEGEGPKEAVVTPLALSLPDQVRMSARGVTRFSLEVANTSSLAVEGVTVAWEGMPAGVRGEGSAPFALAPREKRKLELALIGEGPAPSLFPKDVTLVLTFRYADVALEGPITQRAPLRLVLVEETLHSNEDLSWWIWGVLLLGVALAVWILGRAGLFLLLAVLLPLAWLLAVRVSVL